MSEDFSSGCFDITLFAVKARRAELDSCDGLRRKRGTGMAQRQGTRIRLPWLCCGTA
jgi:hypothetical protein